MLATRPGRLSDLARHLVVPSGVTSTGWPAVSALCRDWGDVFDEWQDGLGRAALARRSDGLYAATVGGVVLSIPRQVAKTFLVTRIVFALCALFPGTRVLWTAHHGATLSNTFRGVSGFAQRAKVAPYVAQIRTSHAEQEVWFVNGSVILFGSRAQGFGRGLDEIDFEVFDEAQILPDQALDDMVAATNQARHPHGALLFFMGTPPRPQDPGSAFTQRRKEALAGHDDVMYVEFSADSDCDPDDREQWTVANPSYPARTPLASMLRLRRQLPSDLAWMREGLGVWDPVSTQELFDSVSWDAAADEFSVPVDKVALGVAVAADQVTASVVLAGQRADGAWHIELDEQRSGSAWVVPYVKALLAVNEDVRAVVLDAGSPESALLDEFAAARVSVMCPKVVELGSAYQALLSGLVTGDVRHTGQPQMNIARQGAGKRPLGQTGMWVLSAKTSTSDITAMRGAAHALHGAMTGKSKVRKPVRRDRGRRRIVVLGGGG